MIWDYKNLSSKTTSSWWLCSRNECCVKADSEKVRQRETDRVAGHIHLGTHHHHHSIIMLLNIVCSWTYAPRFSSSSSLLSSMLLNMRMQLDIYISVIIIVIVNIIPTTIISTILCSWAYTPQCSSPSSSWIIIIIWEDNTAWNEAQSGHCLTVQRDIKFMKRNESHLQIIFPFYGSSIWLQWSTVENHYKYKSLENHG